MKYYLERIKYFLKLTICTALMSFNLCAQDVVNFYKQPPVNLSDFYINNQISSFSRDFIFNSQFFRDYNNGIFFNSQNFDGEYEMCLILHPWYYLFVTPVLNINPHPSYIYTVTYNYEVVSFPFHKECAYVGTGDCTEQTPCSTQVRNMNLPVEDQNPIRPRLKSSTCVRDEDICGSITGVNHLLIYRAQRYLSDVDEWG